MIKPNTHVFIATPAYSGKVNIAYTLAFAQTLHLLTQNNILVTPYISASGSLLVAERNKIIEQFWKSKATHLLCIDGDLGWPAAAVMAMLDTEKEFVAGCYPARGEKNTFLFRPVYKNKKDESLFVEKHLIKMEYIPAGFMLISRSVIAKMREKYPELYYEPKDPRNNPEAGFCFFDTEVYEGEFWGEDYVFCRRARGAGVDIWVDPLIQFDHDGTIGMLIECLTPDPNKPPKPVFVEKKTVKKTPKKKK